jgi:hypothetical protein
MATATKSKTGTHKVTIAVRSFPYRIELPHPYEEGETMINDRIAMRGEEIEVLQPEYERGMRLDAFLKEGQKMEQVTGDQRQSLFSAVDATDTELINWIKDDNPTVQDVIDASEADAETALRLLSAENAATGNDPRKGVIAGLEAVVRRSQE